MIESTTISASAAVQLSEPVRPFSLAKNRQIAIDSQSIFPPYSKTGSFPNGVASRISVKLKLEVLKKSFGICKKLVLKYCLSQLANQQVQFYGLHIQLLPKL